MNFDKVLNDLGEFGRWQKMNLFLLWFPCMMSGVMVLIGSFTLLEPSEYRCKNVCDVDDFQFDDYEEHWKREQLFPCSGNSSSIHCSGEDEFCMFLKPQILDGKCSSKLTNEKIFCNSDSEFVYKQFEMKKTVISEFNMVCDGISELCRPIAESLFMVGLMVGSSVFGTSSDKFGRRNILLIAIMTSLVGNLVGAFLPDCWSYGVSRLVTGAGAVGAYMISFSLTIEILGKKKRLPCAPWVTYSGFFGNIMAVPYALGEIMAVLLSMVFTDWRYLQVASAVLCMMVGFVWFFITESPRWLIATGKEEKARDVIEVAAKRNKVVITQGLESDIETLSDSTEEDGRSQSTINSMFLPVSDKEYGIMDLFNKTSRSLTFPLFIIWPALGLLYFGLTLASGKINVTSDIHLSFILMCLIEIPADFFFPILMDIWGRKPLIATCLFFPGIFCIICAFYQTTWVFTMLIMLAKMGVTGGKNISLIWTAELYPTPLRNTALGVCYTVGRAGSVFAPWVAVYLPEQDSLPPWVPLFIFGVVAILGSLASLLLPETLGSPLPDNFKDVENIKERNKSMCCEWINPSAWLFSYRS